MTHYQNRINDLYAWVMRGSDATEYWKSIPKATIRAFEILLNGTFVIVSLEIGIRAKPREVISYDGAGNSLYRAYYGNSVEIFYVKDIIMESCLKTLFNEAQKIQSTPNAPNALDIKFKRISRS